MSSPLDLQPSRFDLPRANRPLMAFAAIVAISLLSFYMHLLHESMALGEKMRERQRSASTIGPMKSGGLRAPARGATDRNARTNGMQP